MAVSNPNIKNVPPQYRFKYDDTNADFGVWFAKRGEGLPKHQHPYAHAVACTAGKIAVRKENVYLEMTKYTDPVILKENEWHEIEALEDDTTFLNIYPLDQVMKEAK